MLVIFGGLSGVGKTTIAQELARQIGAMHIRIDSIEQAIRNCTPVVPPPLDEAGYRIGYAIARDNLRIGRTVIADSVNPLLITRDTWRKVGQNAQVATAGGLRCGGYPTAVSPVLLTDQPNPTVVRVPRDDFDDAGRQAVVDDNHLPVR